MAGLSYNDVNLLNSSINNVGDSLLKQRMMELEQKRLTNQDKMRQQQLGIEQGRVDVDKQRMEAELTNYKNQGTRAEAAATDKAATNAKRVWSDTVNLFGGWVKDGIVDPQVAQQKLGAAYQAMPPQQQAAVADHPAVKAIQDNTPLWKVPPGRPMNQPAAVATDQAAQDLLNQADDMEDEDPEGADALRTRAQLLRDHLKHAEPKPFQGYQETTTTDQKTGNQTKTRQPLPPVGTPASKPAPAAAGKKLDQPTALKLLKEAGGDKDKARQLAAQRGYTF